MLGGVRESLALKVKTDDLALQQWVIELLLPWTYWHQQADQTTHCEGKVAYQGAAEQAYDRLISHPITQQLKTDRAAWRSHSSLFCGCPGHTGSVQNINVPIKLWKDAMVIYLVSIILRAVFPLKR